jgi:hypothetical protein
MTRHCEHSEAISSFASSPFEAVGRRRRYFRKIFGVNAKRIEVRGFLRYTLTYTPSPLKGEGAIKGLKNE